MWKQPSKGFFKNSVRRILAEFTEFWQNSQEIYARISFLIKLLTLQTCCFIKSKSLAQVFSCEFCENCKNIFFAEHHQTAASYFSSTNGNEGRIGKRNCKLRYKIKAYVPIWVSGKLPPRKIAPRSGSGFGLGLALELRLGEIFLGGNFPRTNLSQKWKLSKKSSPGES